MINSNIIKVLFMMLSLSISGCSYLEYFFETKLKLSAGSSLVSDYIINYPDSTLKKKIDYMIDTDSIRMADTIVLKEVFDSSSYDIYVKQGYLNQTYFKFILNRKKNILFRIETKKNEINGFKSLLILRSAAILNDNMVKTYKFTYKEKMMIIKDFEKDILPYFKE